MIVSEYKLASEKLDGTIVFTFHGGVLYSILFSINKPLSPAQLQALLSDFPYQEQDVMTIAGIRLAEITPKKKSLGSTQEKIALFCSHYSKHVIGEDSTPLKYKVSAKDSGMIKGFDVTDQLLSTYFTSDSVLFKNKYSIGNYCKFYNQLVAEANGASKQVSFPNHWDEKLARKMTGETLSLYFKHLNSLGKKPRKSSRGEIIDFV